MVALNSLGYLLEKLAPTLEAAIIAYKVQYCAGNYLGVLAFLFSLDYIRKPLRKTGLVSSLFIVPLGISALVLHNPLLLVGELRFIPMDGGGLFDIVRPGFFYYLNFIYNSSLLLIGIGLVIRQFVRIGKKGWMHNTVFVSVLVLPLASKLFYWNGILQELDLFYITCTLMLTVLYWYIMHFRQLEWRTLRWDTIMNKMTDAVLVINADKQIVNINTTFFEFFSTFVYNDSSRFIDLIRFLKKKTIQAVPENLFADLENNKKDVIKGEFSVDSDQKTFTFTRQIIRIKDRIMGYTVILNDVSAYRTMIDEIVELKQKAEEGSKTKSEFLATMSHEIRTPLNAIIGFSEILLQQKLPKDAHTNLENIYNSGAVLLGIISDILDISKIEAGNMELTPIEYTIPSLVNDTVHLNLIRIGSKPIFFELEIDETIPTGFLGDELRIKQILNNLLSNAFKYTQEGRVTLQIRWTPIPEQSTVNGKAILCFRVTDTGQGIKKEDIPKLFSQYHQLNAKANRLVEGTGLGLAITKNLVEMMGGSVTIESEFRKGSTFTATIFQDIVNPAPIGKEMAINLQQFRFIDSRRRQRFIIRTQMPKARVLVVDDVQTNLEVARGLMLSYGLTIDGVKSGQEAVDLIRFIIEHPGTSRYDLIFMDHMLPGMDGLEATRLIRSINSDYAREVPIIVLTANALAGNKETFLENGTNDFLAKPIDIQKLDVILEQWIPPEKQLKMSTEAAPFSAGAEEEAVREKIPGIEGVDTKVGLDNTGGSFPVYQHILSVYVGDAAERIPQIQAAADAGDLSRYTTMVHALKSISRSIGAAALGDMAARLEEAGRTGDKAAILEKTEEFLSALQTLTEHISAALSKSASLEDEGTASLSHGELLELKEALSKMDSKKADTLLTEYSKKKLNNTAKELVSGIEQDVLLFEYETAVQKLEKLL
jgi:signal transduction histidine kinase/CheY-like chemotaxis protein